MDFKKVLEIYNIEKTDILRGLKPQNNPIAYILGGQPASGKSGLASVITSKEQNREFLFVNEVLLNLEKLLR